jgi:NTE family protein
LDELGILSSADTLSSVSGGSLFAAHLATALRPWPDPGRSVPDWQARVAAPFRDFTARNVRRVPVLLQLLSLWSDVGARRLSRIYERHLTPLRLDELPDRPRFVFCATDMAFGVSWVFERERLGDYRAGYAAATERWTVGRAAAASSCFPPIFQPLRLAFRPEELGGGEARRTLGRERHAALVARLQLTDGGVYDNFGLEPVWRTHAAVLLSDGGAPFDVAADRGLLWRLFRYVDIQGSQVAALRKRWLVASYVRGDYDGAYWGIGGCVAHYEAGGPGYSESLARDVIATIRTDLDAFDAAECAVLENHGYLLAEAAVARHAPALVRTAAPLAVPHPDWMDEGRVRRALGASGKRTFLGRGRAASRRPSRSAEVP